MRHPFWCGLFLWECSLIDCYLLLVILQKYVMQLAKQVYGASLVVTTGSAGKVDLLKSLGVDKVIDYKKEKYEELPDKYDVVFDTVGKLLSLSQISSLYVCNCTETKPQSRCTCTVSVVEAAISCSLSSLIPGIHQKYCQKTPSLKYPTHVTVFVANRRVKGQVQMTYCDH